jgi:hypothetical protein
MTKLLNYGKGFMIINFKILKILKNIKTYISNKIESLVKNKNDQTLLKNDQTLLKMTQPLLLTLP